MCSPRTSGVKAAHIGQHITPLKERGQTRRSLILPPRLLPGRYVLTLWRFRLRERLHKAAEIALFDDCAVFDSLYIAITQRCADQLAVVGHRRPARGSTASLPCMADVILLERDRHTRLGNKDPVPCYLHPEIWG